MRIERLLRKYKSLETGVEWADEWSTVLDIGVLWRRRCDHAGFELRFTVWRFHAYLFFYDSRHWNEKESRPYYDHEDPFA